jgi:predicted nucleic acid-binding protein
MVLVDTSIWSEAFRRHRVDEESNLVRELRELIREGNAVLIGPIRQELLSGIRSRTQFETLRRTIRVFPDVDLERSDYESAAKHFNTCRSHGIQGSNTDFLICAVAERLQASVFTSDVDFTRFSDHLPVRLHEPRFSPDRNR